MEQKKGKPPSPLSAVYDAGSYKKTADSTQAEKEELNEETKESLYKNVPLHEMSAGTLCSLLQRQSLETVSEHGSPKFSKLPSFLNPSTFSPLSVWPKTANELLAEKEKLKDANELLCKMESQILEQIAADKKFSEESVWDKLRSKHVLSLPYNSSSASPSSFGSLHNYDSWSKSTMRPDPPLPYTLPRRRLNKPISSAQSVRNNLKRKTKGEVGEKRDPVLPTTTVRRDLDVEHSVKSVPARLYYNPSSKKLRTTVPQSKAILPSVTGPLCPENSTEVLQGSSTGEKQKERAFRNKPAPLLDPVPFSAAFNWNVKTPYKSSQEVSDRGYFLIDPTPAQIRADLQRHTLEGLSVSERGSPSFPNHPSFLNPCPCSQSITRSDAGPLYPEKWICRGHSFRSMKKPKKDSFSITSTIDSPHYIFDQLPPGTLTETGVIKTHSSAADATKGVNQDSTTNDGNDLDSAGFYDRKKEWGELCGSIYGASHAYANWKTVACGYGDAHFLSNPSLESDRILHLPNRKDTDDAGPSFKHSSSTFRMPACSQSTARTVTDPPRPQGRPAVLQDSTVCTEGSEVQDVSELLTVKSESKSEGDSDVLVEMEAAVPAVNYSVTNTLQTHSHLQTSSSDPGWTKRGSSCLSRSHSMSSLSQITSTKNKTFTRSNSSPDMLLKNSFEEFTPDITADEDDETYRFQCSCPGLYQCSVTGLVFHMEAGGDVVYRIVPWNRRLLAQHHKQPAGPLFDIKCLQQSVCQLHLPHCEIRLTGGCEFLSVAHVTDEGIEFIAPDKITETHVVINITGFSGFGNVKDGDSSPDPVRALVLLFYRPPADPDLESLLNVLLLPRNVVLRDVLRTRKKLVGDESYIETSPHCKLHPNHEYTLSTCPEDSVLVQPRKAEFDCDNYDNYFPSFQVKLKTVMINIKLLLRDTNSSHIVWEREVCLSSTGVKRSCGQSARNRPTSKTLLDIRSSFIDRVSGPVLQSLLDKLFEKKVMTDSERESANEMQNKRDKARFVIDTVRKKGEAASSKMIECLNKIDRVLFKRLGFKRNNPRKMKR